MNKYPRPEYNVTRPEGDGSLIEIVDFFLGKDKWKHSKNSSRVESVRTVFKSFLAKKLKVTNEKRLAENPNAFKYNVADISVKLAAGSVALTTAELFALGANLAKVTEYGFDITESDVTKVVENLNRDFAESNNWIDVVRVESAYAEKQATQKADSTTSDGTTITEAIDAMADAVIPATNKKVVTV